MFSDVHLGSPVARAYELLNTLKEYHFSKLIIVGDMFEDLNFKHLTSTHWELLEHIGKVSRRGVEVVWIEGNHDGKFLEFMSHMLGVPVKKEYSWEVNGVKFIALHGHQFDNFLSKNPFLGRIYAEAYSFLQRVVSSHFLSFISDNIADRWQRLSEHVAPLAINYAKKKQRNVIVCGHTHFVYQMRKDDVEYFNLGCWIAKPSYLLVIQDNGTPHFEVIP